MICLCIYMTLQHFYIKFCTTYYLVLYITCINLGTLVVVVYLLPLQYYVWNEYITYWMHFSVQIVNCILTTSCSHEIVENVTTTATYKSYLYIHTMCCENQLNHIPIIIHIHNQNTTMYLPKLMIQQLVGIYCREI